MKGHTIRFLSILAVCISLGIGVTQAQTTTYDSTQTSVKKHHRSQQRTQQTTTTTVNESRQLRKLAADQQRLHDQFLRIMRTTDPARQRAELQRYQQLEANFHQEMEQFNSTQSPSGMGLNSQTGTTTTTTTTTTATNPNQSSTRTVGGTDTASTRPLINQNLSGTNRYQQDTLNSRTRTRTGRTTTTTTTGTPGTGPTNYGTNTGVNGTSTETGANPNAGNAVGTAPTTAGPASPGTYDQNTDTIGQSQRQDTLRGRKYQQGEPVRGSATNYTDTTRGNDVTQGADTTGDSASRMSESRVTMRGYSGKENDWHRNTSTLQWRDLRDGNGATVAPGDVVTVRYTGWLQEDGNKGRKFDSSYDRNKDFTFTVGAGQVIKGWDEGIIGMKEGGIRELLIPPQLGYGSSGAGNGVIPANSPLLFQVEVVKIQKK